MENDESKDKPTDKPRIPVFDYTESREMAAPTAAPFKDFRRSHVFIDLGFLLTRPRQSFEFFADESRINSVVRAKIFIVYLLSLLISMLFSTDTQGWGTNLRNFESQMSQALPFFSKSFFRIALVYFLQLYTLLVPLFSILSLMLLSFTSFCSLRMMGAPKQRTHLHSIFFVIVMTQWLSVFSIIPQIGETLSAILLPFFLVIAFNQLSKLGWWRSILAYFFSLLFLVLAVVLIVIALELSFFLLTWVAGLIASL